MTEHKHSVTCPACGGTITAATQDSLIEQVQGHAKNQHGKGLTREQVLEMEKKQAK
jgi:predicted small metal-binding protein